MAWRHFFGVGRAAHAAISEQHFRNALSIQRYSRKRKLIFLETMMFLQLVFEEKTRIPSLFRQTSHNYFWIPYMKFGGALKFTG